MCGTDSWSKTQDELLKKDLMSKSVEVGRGEEIEKEETTPFLNPLTESGFLEMEELHQQQIGANVLAASASG